MKNSFGSGAVHWIELEKGSAHSVETFSYTDAMIKRTTPKVLPKKHPWSASALEKDIEQYDQSLKESMTRYSVFHSQSPPMENRDELTAFERGVRLYQIYIESAMLDFRAFVSFLETPKTFRKYMSCFDSFTDEHNKMYEMGALAYYKAKRHRLIDRYLRCDFSELTLEEFVQDLPKVDRLFWPNAERFESAYLPLFLTDDQSLYGI